MPRIDPPIRHAKYIRFEGMEPGILWGDGMRLFHEVGRTREVAALASIPGDESSRAAQLIKPTHPGGDVADFIDRRYNEGDSYVFNFGSGRIASGQ